MPSFNLAFGPEALRTVTLNVSGTASAAQFTDTSQFPQAPGVRVQNAGDVEVAIEFGGSNVVADFTKSMVIPPGIVEVFRCGGASWISGVTAGGAGKIRATPGYGV